MSSTKVLLRVGVLAAALAFAGTQSAIAQVKQEAEKATGTAGHAITDGWLTMKIHAQFIPEKALDNSDINVDTNNGMVTLRGTVPTAGARDRAVAIAKATDGVKGVTSNLTIAAPAGKELTDGWIKTKLYGKFVEDKTLDNSDINVDVSKGVVTLKGHVPSESARTHAVALAKASEGVKSVTDSLTVSPAAR